jgi:hypothetical protein
MIQSGRMNFRSGLFRYVYFFPAAIFGWVLFRVESLSSFQTISTAMLNPFSSKAWHFSNELIVAIAPVSLTAFAIGTLAILVQSKMPAAGIWLSKTATDTRMRICQSAFAITAIVCCWMLILPSKFSPFLYFRF